MIVKTAFENPSVITNSTELPSNPTQLHFNEAFRNTEWLAQRRYTWLPNLSTITCVNIQRKNLVLSVHTFASLSRLENQDATNTRNEAFLLKIYRTMHQISRQSTLKRNGFLKRWKTFSDISFGLWQPFVVTQAILQLN